MRLPLSGLEIVFREPDGEAEAAFASCSPGRPVASATLLLEQLCRLAGGGSLAPETLTLTDFETALAGLRGHWLGDQAVSHPHCPECGEQVELSFSLAALAGAAVPPRPGTASEPGEVDGIAYRLPTAGDARAAEGHADASRRLFDACVPERPPAPVRRRIERAIARSAPLLSREIAAPCAACGALLRAVLHVPSFVVVELASLARSLFEEVHLIASAYGWSESDILKLPRTRRRLYAARLRAGA